MWQMNLSLPIKAQSLMAIFLPWMIKTKIARLKTPRIRLKSFAPKDGFHQFSGSSLLQLVEQFGMRYGVMNLFHRYEDKDGTGMLWFSMIGMGVDGMSPFDLNTMPQTDYQGVALFLSLPHPKALQGFDSMMSIAGLMAKQLDARITLGDGEPLTRENKHHLRNHVQDYMQAYQERG